MFRKVESVLKFKEIQINNKGRKNKVKYSYEELLDNFTKDLLNAEPMYIVIKGHLYVEYYMRELLEAVVEKPQYMPNLNFANKVKWLATLDVIDEKTKNALEAINKLRNNYAHELMLKLTLDDIHKFIQKFSREDQEVIKGKVKERGAEEDRQLHYAFILIFARLSGILDFRVQKKSIE
ncbi:hypothetical protein COL81_13865 [Bacillus toyonensis]|nr:hypothetical protein COL81_13865 [Bacillus toyonensis]